MNGREESSVFRHQLSAPASLSPKANDDGNLRDPFPGRTEIANERAAL
jgi:hypothetical protein